MKIRRLKKTVALLAAAAIAAAVGPATAAPPWVVTAGTQTSGQVPFTAYTKTGIQFAIDGNSGLVNFNCGAGAAAGVIYPGSYPTGIRIAEIEGIAWSNCIGPSGMPLNIYQVANSKWRLNLTGTGGNPRSGYIDQINAPVKSKTKAGGVPICSYFVTGRMDTAFNTTQVAGSNNYTKTITANQPFTIPNLTVSNIFGCFGLLSTGDAMGLNGSFKVHNSTGLVTIS